MGSSINLIPGAMGLLASMSVLVSLILLVSLPWITVGRSVLSENGYSELVVAISPDIPQNMEMVDQVKNLLTEASRELYIATKRRAYFKQVKILLPKTWTGVTADQTLEGESFDNSEIRIDRP